MSESIFQPEWFSKIRALQLRVAALEGAAEDEASAIVANIAVETAQHVRDVQLLSNILGMVEDKFANYDLTEQFRDYVARQQS